MTTWLVRAGGDGEYEERFLRERRIYLTWDGLGEDLSRLVGRQDLVGLMNRIYPDTKPKTISNWSSQVWPFAKEMKESDIVVLPLKTQRTIQIGRIASNYQFVAEGPDPFFHYRDVEWIGESIPRDHFGQDLLHSFGAFMTICRIQRNQAEQRIVAMRDNGWKRESIAAVVQDPAPAGSSVVATVESESPSDLEEAGLDQISRLVMARFRGHSLTRLVEGILKAQGYVTYRSPEGADGGVDILAGAGPLGFGSPRLCVEVKSESSPIDRPTVDKLLGAMTKFGAQEGLFVSWGGFKSNVQKELAQSFFRVRLWNQSDLLQALFANYDRLEAELRAELPLKRIWTVALPDPE